MSITHSHDTGSAKSTAMESLVEYDAALSDSEKWSGGSFDGFKVPTVAVSQQSGATSDEVLAAIVKLIVVS